MQKKSPYKISFATVKDFNLFTDCHRQGVLSGAMLDASALKEIAQLPPSDSSISDQVYISRWLTSRSTRDNFSENYSKKITGLSVEFHLHHKSYKILWNDQNAGVCVFKTTKKIQGIFKELDHEIHYIFVYPAFRGKGLSKLLIEHACMANTVRPIHADIMGSNPQSAAAFSSCGFSFVGTENEISRFYRYN